MIHGIPTNVRTYVGNHKNHVTVLWSCLYCKTFYLCYFYDGNQTRFSTVAIDLFVELIFVDMVLVGPTCVEDVKDEFLSVLIQTTS